MMPPRIVRALAALILSGGALSIATLPNPAGGEDASPVSGSIQISDCAGGHRVMSVTLVNASGDDMSVALVVNGGPESARLTVPGGKTLSRNLDAPEPVETVSARVQRSEGQQRWEIDLPVTQAASCPANPGNVAPITGSVRESGCPGDHRTVNVTLANPGPLEVTVALQLVAGGAPSGSTVVPAGKEITRNMDYPDRLADPAIAQYEDPKSQELVKVELPVHRVTGCKPNPGPANPGTAQPGNANAGMAPARGAPAAAAPMAGTPSYTG